MNIFLTTPPHLGNLFCLALNHSNIGHFVDRTSALWHTKVKLSISVLYRAEVIMLANRNFHSVFFYLKKGKVTDILRLRELVQQHTQNWIEMCCCHCKSASMLTLLVYFYRNCCKINFNQFQLLVHFSCVLLSPNEWDSLTCSFIISSASYISMQFVLHLSVWNWLSAERLPAESG